MIKIKESINEQIYYFLNNNQIYLIKIKKKKYYQTYEFRLYKIKSSSYSIIYYRNQQANQIQNILKIYNQIQLLKTAELFVDQPTYREWLTKLVISLNTYSKTLIKQDLQLSIQAESLYAGT
ncbi:hypothetical protein ABPG73_001881 [Tetrahymena malaccensis]